MNVTAARLLVSPTPSVPRTAVAAPPPLRENVRALPPVEPPANKPIATCPLLALRTSAASVSAAEQRALASFVSQAGLDNAVVTRVMAKAPGDKLETAKMYAVLADAANGKVTPERAKRLHEVMSAIENGRVRVIKTALVGSRAEYNHTTNTVSVPSEGASLTKEADRVALVHEAEHVSQDIRRSSQTRYASEAEGHEAAADYLLHLAGAVIEDSAGTHIDIKKASATIATLQQRQYETLDIVAANHLCLRIAQQTTRRGDALDVDVALKVFAADNFAIAYDNAQTGVGKSTASFSTIMHKQGL